MANLTQIQQIFERKVNVTKKASLTPTFEKALKKKKNYQCLVYINVALI